MLDISNGELKIKAVTFGPRLTQEEFVNTDLYHEILREDNYGYTRYELRPQSMLGERWAIHIYLNEKQMLEMISLSSIGEEETSSWESWSEEKELEKKARHDDLLFHWLGNPPYKYRWGEVSSQYDPRSGSSDITIRYNPAR